MVCISMEYYAAIKKVLGNDTHNVDEYPQYHELENTVVPLHP